jgi:hypothetical protein
MNLLLRMIAIGSIAPAGCCLVPDSIRPEVEHLSHVTQHEPFTSHATNYGADVADIVAHWDIRKAYVEIGEGIALDRASGCARCGDAGYGEIVGPREQFIARAGFVFDLKR